MYPGEDGPFSLFDQNVFYSILPLGKGILVELHDGLIATPVRAVTFRYSSNLESFYGPVDWVLDLVDPLYCRL